MPINGEPGVAAFLDGRLVSVITFETREGAIARIYGFANPQKLAYVASILGVETYFGGRPNQ